MPIDPPTAEERDARGFDLRDRAALVRAHGWKSYESIWSTGEVLGVRAVLNEPGALDEAVELWAPTLWGVKAAELDAKLNYDLTRRWFAATQALGSARAETVQELTPAMSGTWRVTTQGSEHIWDLDRRAYTRIPSPGSGSGASPGDGEPHGIVRVHVWPKVGECFHLLYESWPAADQWRVSSTVREIERVTQQEDR